MCACGGREFENLTLPDAGKVVTYTIIRVAPADFTEEVPYALGIVELEGGTRLMAQIVDVLHDEIKTGMPVRLEFRKIYQEGEAGIICYGHKAVPAS
ncbi:MAG: transcriptional regulator [candidate division Zixibacteria bacterium]|nr:transcriptional regulator [candidate division Zixibacteria bacterium]